MTTSQQVSLPICSSDQEPSVCVRDNHSPLHHTQTAEILAITDRLLALLSGAEPALAVVLIFLSHGMCVRR